MHFHLEIIMPPTEDVHAAVKSVLAPFDERLAYDADSGEGGHSFYDYYAIETCSYAKEKFREVRELSPEDSAWRVIIAGPDIYGDTVANFMISQKIWNGVGLVPAAWDGKLSSAIEMWKKEAEGWRDEWHKRLIPSEDWLVVSVDYHS